MSYPSSTETPCTHLRCVECTGRAWCCTCTHFYEVRAEIRRKLEESKRKEPKRP